MENNSSDSNKQAIDSLLPLFISMVYFLLFCAIAGLAYLLLQDQIQGHFNQKIYSAEELAQITLKAEGRHREKKAEANWDRVENGIHIRTGLYADPNLSTIIGTCTSCHSAKLIAQNKATREGWKSMITWMQETQGLQDLGKSEPIILDYLAKYYKPTNTGRRKNIDIEAIEWYVLNLAETPE